MFLMMDMQYKNIIMCLLEEEKYKIYMVLDIKCSVKLALIAEDSPLQPHVKVCFLEKLREV